MYLIDSYICTKNPEKLQQVIQKFLLGIEILDRKYISTEYNVKVITQYKGLLFLTNRNRDDNSKDFRKNKVLLSSILPKGWKLQNNFGFVCEIVPHQAIDE